ncbi:LamG domain-containing protein [Pedobacter sp. N23S346]|uniref:LamG domain-containing protein n=1 Tax=Pedobacter sp. N23S346 TaxID=3402750 RepID=UPI003ACECC69
MNFNKNSRSFIYLLYVCLGTLAISSCKDDANLPDYASNKTGLSQLADSVNRVYSGSAEGNDIGQYPKQARAELKTALDLATSVTTGAFTQEEVNNALANLRRAAVAFNARKIEEVAADNLVAKWLFNGNALDATANGHNGTLMSGIIGTAANYRDAGILPVATTDRFGRAGNAYAFDNGAYIEIPYSAALNPSILSISLWVNVKESSADNYMISMNKWNGFKFQLQSDNFLFMTLKTTSATYDRDSNPGKMAVGKWHHAVVTAGNGAITFYVDGIQTRTESAAGSAFRLTTPVNIAIGQILPKGILNFTDTSSPFYFSSAAYFRGSLDDIRYYNKALSSDEVLRIYNNEKPD